eukprot:m.207188 g.207188  ORF g.207188 m.207188 type:complete len:849 (-) comp18921_c0_seq1:149-2695(-)
MTSAAFVVAFAYCYMCLRVAADRITVGSWRVDALSPTLVRIEPSGPLGFEDRPTFGIRNRTDFGRGIPIKLLNQTAEVVWLKTDYYFVRVPVSSHLAPLQCNANTPNTDGKDPVRAPEYPNGTKAETVEACCSTCSKSQDCTAYIFASDTTDGRKKNCWLLQSVAGTRTRPNRIFGQRKRVHAALVASLDGTVLWSNESTFNNQNILHWPSPLNGSTYAVVDYPRFFVPPWGASPAPSNASIDLIGTNGYDFRNNVNGDTYVFLLGNTLDGWYHGRGEFLRLTGPTPLLPDYSYGTWYTWYIPYTEEEAKSDIYQWEVGNFPLDVWALDMNWRNTTNASRANPYTCRSQTNNNTGCQDHYYSHPNLTLMPGLATLDNDTCEWFNWLKQRGLHTYFNDHPYPIAKQATTDEILFRWEGLLRWMKRGLSYWWFDHNWAFTLPAPFENTWTQDSWEGLSGAIWGSHVYYTVVAAAHALLGIEERPIVLSRDNGPGGWRTGDPNTAGNGVVGHHRYPVWWTGDGVPLYASVQSMVDESVHDFRPYVHSDCGGHGVPTDEALLRWTGHCVFGTILRYHQGDHRFWLRSNQTQDYIRKYLQTRYSLAPSLIAAGRVVQTQGFPPVARCDMLWPEYTEARANLQYMHLNASLIAPLEEAISTRDVWIPPGAWQDAWNGTVVTGPGAYSVTKPAQQIPMWHRRGSVVVTTADRSAQRMARQSWDTLVLEAFPDGDVANTHVRVVHGQEHLPSVSPVRVTMTTDGHGVMTLDITSDTPQVTSAYVVRLHLRQSERVTAVLVDGQATPVVVHAPDSCDSTDVFPFSGEGTRPACGAGVVVEFRMPVSTLSHTIKAHIV